MPTANDIRQQFIDFFVATHDHRHTPSSPVVPYDDPTLLFTNAGMNQFKPYFLGTEDPDHPRAANTQKCIRAGGKHNDLDDVGKDTYHHTFFEMLGNWSFGDYFKAEAIDWAWQLLTEVWGLDPARLHATYFEGDAAENLDPDNEARELWLKHLPAERIHPGNKKDNFWEMGDTGPCGPCSELHYDGTDDLSGAALVNQDDPRVIEIWNLVFIQFNRGTDGNLTPLPAKHIDTGMGFERIVRVIQGKHSNYDTDVFGPLFDAIQSITGAHAYSGNDDDPVDVAYRVIADHARCLTFALTDGAVPSNDGRGYVLRRILRRGVRYGRQSLGMTEPFIHKLVPTIAEHMGGAFPELTKDPARVADIIKDEEESFGRTLDRGIELFERAVADLPAGAQFTADDAFKLHDTFGFPLDLTQLMAEERGLAVDVAGFDQLMEAAREKARAGGSASGAAKQTLVEFVQQNELPDTRFVGYTETVHDGATLMAKLALADDAYKPIEKLEVGQRAAIVVDVSPFYAESGGQVGDTGYLRTHEGAVFRVDDTLKVGEVFFHLGQLEAGSIHKHDKAIDTDNTLMLEVHADRRALIMSNHTVTHVMNRALRSCVNPEADQRGSLVDDEKTRFDFTHTATLTPDQVAAVEKQVNADIEADLSVDWAYAPQEDALKINGLRAVFGEKYPPTVRVVSIGPKVQQLLESPDAGDWAGYSIEFCGGIHVRSTGVIQRFTIVSEESVSKGVRRITAYTGDRAAEVDQAGQQLLDRLAALDDAEGDDLQKRYNELAAAVNEKTLPLVARRNCGPGWKRSKRRSRRRTKRRPRKRLARQSNKPARSPTKRTATSSWRHWMGPMATRCGRRWM